MTCRCFEGPAALTLALGTALALAPRASAANQAPSSNELVDPPVEIYWEAPRTCPSETEFITALEQQLGGPLADRVEQRFTAIAYVTPEGEDLQLSMWTVDARGTRQRVIQGQDCAWLAKVGVWLLARSIDPELAGSRPAGLDHEDTGVLPASEQTPPPPIFRIVYNLAVGPSAEPEPASARTHASWTGGVRLGLGYEYGVLPGHGVGLRLGAGAIHRHVRILADVAYSPRREARYEQLPEQGVDLHYVGGAFTTCPQLTLANDHLELGLCVGLELGSIFGRLVGYDEDAQLSELWLATNLSLLTSYRPVEWLGLWIDPLLSLPLLLPELRDPRGTIYQPTRPSVRVLVGAEFRFGLP